MKTLWCLDRSPNQSIAFTDAAHPLIQPRLPTQKYSEWQQILWDLFLMLVFIHQQDINDLIDLSINIPVVPSLWQTAAPRNSGRALLLDVLFDNVSVVSDLFQLVMSNRYLNTRSPTRTWDIFDLARLFDMCDEDFKQAVRTTKSGSIWLLNQITLNPIFHSASFRPQLPIPHQLALNLERLGFWYEWPMRKKINWGDDTSDWWEKSEGA
jgi:hypothetical protein